MESEVADGVVAELEDRVGDGLLMVVRFTEDEDEVVYGEEWFAEYLETTDTRSPEQMHEDAVYRLQQADLTGDLYDTSVHAELQVTDDGTGIYLFPSGREGVFVWLTPDTEVLVPELVDGCLATLGGR